MRDTKTDKQLPVVQAGDRLVGTLDRTGSVWLVIPDGKRAMPSVVIHDKPKGRLKTGVKVVAEVVNVPQGGGLPTGVIAKTLGKKGQLDVETRAIMHMYGLSEKFGSKAMSVARKAVAALDSRDMGRREDLADLVIATIDPPDAKDYDDAISVEEHPDGTVTLGVHIADVSHFVEQGTLLDAEARERGTSVYFPGRVVPMLPEILLSNGVCSLQEGQRRLAKSVFLTYDAQGVVSSTRFAESVIVSTMRLTYEQAQAICDGGADGFPGEIVGLVRSMERLARKIERRRRAAGMIHLDLPEVELVLDENGRVEGAVPEDSSYAHTIIEMFMVEANEAVAALFHELEVPIVRRIHPEPDDSDIDQLRHITRAFGHGLPAHPLPADLQTLIDAVAGRPEGHAINLAVLRSFQQASYSTETEGHFALSGEHYCHFTSPIRRYPDLSVHRTLTRHLRGKLRDRADSEIEPLAALAESCSVAERRAQSAELELKLVLVLQHLEQRVGETFDGVVTAVSQFGLFVGLPSFLIDGLVRLKDLGQEWWEVEVEHGRVRGESTGTIYRMGDALKVLLTRVDVARRHLDLTPTRPSQAPPSRGRAGKKKTGYSKRRYRRPRRSFK